ncbi:MAG: NAD(P)H-dependent oxidoreductase [Coprobacillus sp.]
MKITIIHGQSHKQTSYHIGKYLLEALGADNEITEYFLPRDLNTFCIGCYQCIIKDETHCPHYDKISVIKASMEEAELIIFTSPVYCMHVSAPMKSLLDHCFQYYMIHQPKAEMFHKKAVIMTVGAGVGMKKAAKDIKDSLIYWGISQIYTYTLVGQAMTFDDINDERREKIRADIQKLADKVKHGQLKVSLKTKSIFYIMRMMQRKGWTTPQDKEYWQQKGWLLKERPWR